VRKIFQLFALVATLVVGVSSSRAEFPDFAFYLGINGGGNFVLRDWDLRNEHTPTTNTPGTSGVVGFRLGVQMVSWIALEGEFEWLPLTSSTGDRNHVMTYDLNILFHLMRTNWAPIVEAGVGVYNSVSGDLGTDLDPRFHLGVGVRGLLTRWLVARADLRDIISDGMDKGGSNNLELTVGLEFLLSFAKEEPPPAVKVADRDSDGVLDDKDECPDAAGPKATKGCPDSDGDGIADRDDACPKEKGTEALKGCPDKDGDGVADAEDKCPDQAGPVALKGCPDKDGDGVPDPEDRCPAEKGTAALKGCPDSDGDGIADKDDQCPKESGTEALKGCPDKDGDGVADKDDKCPDVAGLKELQGCMPEAAKKFAGSMKGITFAAGSAKIAKTSNKILDETAKLLTDYPTMKLGIEGHTDNQGKAAKNQALSQARADSVRDYLVKKGLAAERLDSKGFGDTKPIANNKNAKGRAANRRIEFHISAQ
jgi:outer membrane protein OmpA-like peptidoglycan-associated protein